MKNRPNIIIITSHDSGRHFGFCGAENVATPKLDALAQDSTHLTNFHAAGPICSPSRASLLTGLYPQRHGVRGIPFMDSQYELRCPEKTLSRICQNEGYETALVGIQHITAYSDRLGFDHQIATENPTAPGPQIAEAACSFIRKRAEATRPFYLEVGTFESHTPYDWGGRPPAEEVPDAELPPLLDAEAEAKQVFGQFMDALSVLDHTVGQIIDQLRASGIYEDSLIVFNVDHGAELPRAKWYLYDAGLHVPVLIKWPEGYTAPTRYDGLLHSIDFLPTLLDFLDIDAEERDGHSFLKAIREDGPGREETFACFMAEDLSIRTQTHKLILSAVPRPAVSGAFALHCRKEAAIGLQPPVQLFDLINDPDESHNLANDPGQQELLADLAGRLKRHLVEMNDSILEGPDQHWHYRKTMDLLNG